ncbi:MAG: hypothetical protein Q8Q62_04955 [Mesorhizobium sp.]|nr:hypothetical protein [Mesorhizobium sp.]
MQSVVFRSHSLGRFLAGSFMLIAAGCQSNDTAGTLDVAGAGSKEKVTQEELLSYCPVVSLREGTAYFNTYTKDGKDDPAKIIYQASISDVTRSCTNSGGMMTMNVAVAGRVVPGPVGQAGTIKMPIRVVVVRGAEVVYTQLHDYQVQVGGTATQFVFNDPAVIFPTPAKGTVQVFAGFDEGPPQKKKPGDE